MPHSYYAWNAFTKGVALALRRCLPQSPRSCGGKSRSSKCPFCRRSRSGPKVRLCFRTAFDGKHASQGRLLGGARAALPHLRWASQPAVCPRGGSRSRRSRELLQGAGRAAAAAASGGSVPDCSGICTETAVERHSPSPVPATTRKLRAPFRRDCGQNLTHERSVRTCSAAVVAALHIPLGRHRYFSFARFLSTRQHNTCTLTANLRNSRLRGFSFACYLF